MRTVTAYFVDRVGEIDQLNAALNSEGSTRDSFVVLHGQRGIGKTQLLAKYLRDCNGKEIRVSHVDLEDLITKGYLGLIEAIIEDLGNDGFEALDELFDNILIKSQIEQGRAVLEGAAVAFPGQGLGQAQSFTFNAPVTGQAQTFVTGDVTYHNAKIENIYHIHLAEPEQVADLIQNRITRAFRSCLQNISREQLVVILLDQWDKAGDLLQKWLNDHLISWATELTLKKALIVMSSESLPPEVEHQLGILPLAISPFTREFALEFWRKNGLPEEAFHGIGMEVYSIPGILALEVGKHRLKQGLR